MNRPTVLPDRRKRIARPHVPKTTPVQGSWIVEGGVVGGGGGGTGGAAPPVTIDPVAEVVFRSNHVIEVDVVWTPAASATPANFSGVSVFIEDPDISTGSQTPLDGSVVLDGSAQVSGEWAPVHANDTAKSPAVVFPDSAMGGADGKTYTQSRNVRIYLASYGPGSPPVLVRANEPGATPNIMVEIPIGPGQGQSGMEWAFLVSNPAVTVTTDYNRPDPNYYLTFTYDPPDPSIPVPPGVHRFGGVRIVYVQFDAQGNEIFPGTDTGIDIPVAQAASGFKSPIYTASAGGSSFRCYFCSEDDAAPVGMHINSLVDGVTPYADATVPPLTAKPSAPSVTNFTISNERSQWQLDNTFVAQADFAWDLPDSSADNRALYAGVRLYLVNVQPDTGNDGSVPLSDFPQALSDIQANVDTKLTLYETPPAKPEIWTIAAISIDAQGGLADDPAKFGQASFHSPTVVWHIGPPQPGSPGSGLEYAPPVTVSAGAQATAKQSMSSDGVGMVSFTVGPWTNPSDASFGSVQVAMVINKDPGSAVYWSVPKNATSFTTPPMASFGNVGANVPVDFYLVSDDPQGHKNSLITSATGSTGVTPKIASTFVPSAGEIIPARDGWFSSEFSWPDGGEFQADAFASKKIFVGSQLVVGGAPSSFNGPNGQNGQIAVKRGDGTLVAWMGQSEPGLGQGQGKSGVYGGWWGQIYVGGTSPLDAPVYVDNNGIIQVGGIAPAQNNSTYPYISIRDDHGLEVGRIGAKLNAPAPTGSQGTQGGVGTSPPALTTGAWFTQAAFGGSNLSNWNILITPDAVNPLGSDFLMRNIRILSIDYPAYQGTGPGDPSNAHYQLLLGSQVWHATDNRTNTSWQFPGIHLFEPDPNNTGQFGATFLSRGLVMRGPAAQGYNVLGSLVMWNGQQSGNDVPPFWCELAMYSPVAPYNVNVQLSSGTYNNGSAQLYLRDYNGSVLFGSDPSGNVSIAGVLQGVQSGGTQMPVKVFALNIGAKPVIDAQGNWVGNPIAGTGGAQSPWTGNISGQGFSLWGAGEIHGTTFWLGGANAGQGTPMINSLGQFVGNGVDVLQGIACTGLSTIAHGGLGEIDCGLVRSNNNVIVTQANVSNLGGTGWVVADNIAARFDIGCATLHMNGQLTINSNGAFVSPGGIDVQAGIGGNSLTIRGRANCNEVYSIGALYYGESLRLPNGTVVIDQSRNFSGASLNASGNVDCASATVTGNLSCGSLSLSGLFSCGQIAVAAQAADAVTAGLVGFGQFRAVRGNYGVFLRNDGGAFYILQTAAGNPYGIWNNYRPFTLDLSNGNVGLGGDTDPAIKGHVVSCAANLQVATDINVGGGVYANGDVLAYGNILVGGNFHAPNTAGLWINNTSGVGKPIVTLWNDNNVYIDNGGYDIYLRPAANRFVVIGSGAGGALIPNGANSADLGAPSYRWGTLWVTNLNVSGSVTGINITTGVTSINGYAGAVTLYQGVGMSVTGYGNGLMLQTVQDISTNGQPTFANVTCIYNLKAQQIQNSNLSAVMYANGNIGCQDLNSNTVTNGGRTVIQNGQFIGAGVVCPSFGIGGSGFNCFAGGGWCYGQTPFGTSTWKTIQFTDGSTLTCRIVGGLLTN